MTNEIILNNLKCCGNCSHADYEPKQNLRLCSEKNARITGNEYCDSWAYDQIESFERKIIFIS